MAKISNEIIKEFFSIGKIVEGNFAKDLMASEGGVVFPSSRNDDVVNHIDLYWTKNNKTCSFDVKGARKKRRSDTSVSYDATWLELKNIAGQDGSLCGKEDYIAFEMQTTWMIVRRKELLKNLLLKITDNTIYRVNPNEDFKLYQRKDRKDVIVRVPYVFIMDNTVKIISKTIDN
jgi:hypothetical protein